MDDATPDRADVRGRGRARVAIALAVAALALTLAACGSDDDGGASSDTALSEEVSLGELDKASGTPVKVGFISDGRGTVSDNSEQIPAAEATVSFINDYHAGIGGRPIELVHCEAEGDPGKATECANKLVRDGVVAVVTPEFQNPAEVYRVLKAAKVPMFNYGVTTSEILQDDTGAAFVLTNVSAGLADMPIAVAKQNKVKRVTGVVIDVPAATDFFTNIGATKYKGTGIEWKMVRVPLGKADMTPEMTEIANGPDTEVYLVGNDSFCIAAMNGLEQAGFEGPISVVNTCTTEATAEGVGDYFDGTYTADAVAINDPNDEDAQLWREINRKYGANVDPIRNLATFLTWYSFRLALEDIGQEITPAAVVSTLKSMKSTPLPGGMGKLEFRCNGKAVEDSPATCSKGSLTSQLDAEGETNLPYEVVNPGPIPD
jgi:branched-chain amino acid transport system substrate-binding protein